MASANAENATHFSCGWQCLIIALPKKSWAKATNFANKTKKLGQDDPRRTIHSLKVGLALTLVSMLFYVQALYDSFGVAAMWAIMTVVVVMEFSVGATLGKGLNRMVGTLLGGSLGFSAQQLVTLPGKMDQPILIAISLYIMGAVMTFIRFVPGVKAKYDYGFSIFMLSFSLVSISGYRSDEKQILQLACKRILTIIIGSFLSIIISICIWPVWIGEDLHNFVASNMQKLGDFLEGFGDDYSNVSQDRKPKTDDKSFAEEYENVLNSKTKEETMANLATWEPCHGMFKFRHPWKEYLKVGNSTRQCACKIEALDYYIQSKIQKIAEKKNYDHKCRCKLQYSRKGHCNDNIEMPKELGNKIKDSCHYTCLESVWERFEGVIKSMSSLSTTNKAHIANAKGAIESLSSILKSNPSEGVDVPWIVAVAAVSSLLTDVVMSIEVISEAVDELASLAHFKTTVDQSNKRTTKVTRPLLLLREGIMKRIFSRDKFLHNIGVNESSACSPKENGTSSIAVIVQSV